MTAWQLYLHPAAVEEAEVAARWYRERSLRASARFVDEVNQTIDKIFGAPHRWPRGSNGTRKAKLPCFPFIVIYRASDEIIQILAVAHGRRRPGYWRNRL
jgi:plasmid stabilization system protein ParE